jgi:formylglycine-generating enzyme
MKELPKITPGFYWLLIAHLLIFGGVVPIGMPRTATADERPEARSALTCDQIRAKIKQVTRQLQKAKSAGKRSLVRRLRKQLRTLKLDLAGCSTLPTIEMVTVGNPGNAADPGNTTSPNVYGAVAEAFRIGKYEVTLDEYAAFLNAVAATDPYELYFDDDMATDLQIAGIQRNGASGAYTYTVIGSGKRPVTYVDWFDAARFCNWLHNGRPRGPQSASTTESGAYALNGATTGLSITREATARYWVPSEDEWYKAAYHHPNSLGGPADDYYLYPTMSDSAPGNQVSTTPNQANVYSAVYSVTQAAGPASLTQNYLTDAGAFSASASHYGTFDQGGNVWELTEGINGSTCALRGSSWDNLPAQMLSSFRGGSGERLDTIGFRVAGRVP